MKGAISMTVLYAITKVYTKEGKAVAYDVACLDNNGAVQQKKGITREGIISSKVKFSNATVSNSGVIRVDSKIQREEIKVQPVKKPVIKESLKNILSLVDKLSNKDKSDLITQLLDVDSALTFLEKVEKDRGLEEKEAARAWDIGLGWFNRDIEREEKEIFK